MAAVKEISADAEVAVLSQLDFIFKLKEEQKPTQKAFLVGRAISIPLNTAGNSS